MKFYSLHEGFYEGVELRLDHLKAACEKLNIEFIAINSLKADYSNLPKLKKTDLLYNSTRGSETLETLLLNKEVTTFYTHNPDLVVSNADTTKYSIIHDKANLPSPKTIFSITTDRQLLKSYVDYLGGFPIVIKAIRSTRGIGTIKIESWQNLISTVDYLLSSGDKFILREFIKNKGTARLIVLGNNVIASVFRENLKDDFRVSGQKSYVDYKKDFDYSTKQLAIKAVNLAGFETAGVDIIFDEKENPYLLEVNFPHDFIRPQFLTGVDIALKSIEYLILKSKTSDNMNE